MNNNNMMLKISLLTVLFMIVLTSSLNLFAAGNLNEELEDKYKEKLNYKKEVYDRTLRFVNDNLNSPDIASLFFNLAEMSTEINVNNPSITADFYKKVLFYDKDFLHKDVVLYNIGFYSFRQELDKRNTSRQNNIELVMNWPDSLRLTEDKLDYIIDSYQELTEAFPESEYYSEAYFRLGIVYFELALDARTPQIFFQKSVENFDKVAKMEDDKLQNYGLFQRAWTYFTMGNFNMAIEDFTSILEIITTDSIEIEATFFKADAIENIAFSLIEYDGTDFVQYSKAAAKAKELFHTFVADDYGKEILLKSIELKQKYNAPMQAADLYNAFITLYPGSLECPSFVDSIVTIYTNNPNRTRQGTVAEDLILDQYKRLTVEFRADSVWYQTNKDKDISKQLEIIKAAYEFLEPKYYNIFAQSKTEEDYQNYKYLIQNYTKFSEFDSPEYLAKINKNVMDFSQDLAENMLSPKLYFETIDNINDYLNTNPDKAKRFQYQEMKFYNYERIYALLDSTIDQSSYVDTIRNLHLDREGLDSLFIAAAFSYEDFLKTYDSSGSQTENELIRIVYQRAELYYQIENYDEAFYDFEKILQYNADNDIKKVCYSRMAEISQNRNNFDEAENYYREAVKYATTEEKESYNNNILATMQAKATTFTDSADYVTAAKEYLRLSDELKNTDPDKSIGFIVSAIENYKKAEQNQTAIDLYLDIASRKSEKNEILAAYLNAWTISDSLQDWSQSEKLRKQFINKYKTSNEAYKLRLQIIGFYEGEQFNDKEKAAQLYLQLHDEADDIDIGEDSKASIFLNAYRIYAELENENKLVELSLRFDKLYPDHPKATDFLVNVARIYNDRGEDTKFEELAAYLYKKDPSIDLLVQVAAEKLKNVNAEVDTFFEAGQFELMFEKIKEFENMEKHYIAEGLELPTDEIYDNFTYYTNYANFNEKFNKVLADVKTGFLAMNPDELIRVNELTEWQKHLVEGKRRIPKLMETADEERGKIIAIIQEGNQYDLKAIERTEALYLAAQVYDYSADVVITQIQKYLDISNQLNNDQMQSNPVQQKQFKDTILNNGQTLKLDFLKRAVQLYRTILTTFAQQKDYSGLWVEKTYARLVELGIEKPKVYEYYYSDNAWKSNKERVTDIADVKNNPITWKKVNIDTEKVAFDSAYAITLSDTFSTYLRKDIVTEMKPELLTISYAFKQPVELYINNTLVEKESEMAKEFANLGGELIPTYSFATSKLMTGGENQLIFKLPAAASSQEISLFAAGISLQYDEAALEHYRTTQQFTLVSDHNWLTKKVDEDLSSDYDNAAENIRTEENNTDTLMVNEAVPDTTLVEVKPETWVKAGDSNFKFFQAQMYGLEKSEALGIWYPVMDSNKVEVVDFKKSFEILGEVTDANIKCIGQNTVTIWINGELLVEESGVVVDDRLKKILPFERKINNLKPGTNIIEITVNGGREFKGMIFEMNYRAKKTLDKTGMR